MFALIIFSLPFSTPHSKLQAIQASNQVLRTMFDSTEMLAMDCKPQCISAVSLKCWVIVQASGMGSCFIHSVFSTHA